MQQSHLLTQDIGNIIHLEHININIPNDGMLLAQRFYLDILGLTFDSSRDGNSGAMWVNAGKTQFHIVVEEKPQVIIGTIGLAVPSLDAIIGRCVQWTKRGKFEGTQFQYRVFHDSKRALTPWRSKAIPPGKRVQITGPWGNNFELFETHHITMVGIVFVQFDVPEDALGCIEATYASHFHAPVGRSPQGLEIICGGRQRLIYCPPKYHQYERSYHQAKGSNSDEHGYHVAVYVGDFSGTFARMQKEGLIYVSSRFRDQSDTIEKAQFYRQFRFKDFKSGHQIQFELEHEIRSVCHSSFLRPMINRIFPIIGYEGDGFSNLAKL